MTSVKNRRGLEKSVAKTYGSFSLALFATGLLTLNVSGGFWWLPLVILGGFSAIFSALVWFGAFKRRGEQIVERATALYIGNIAWFLGISTLGIAVMQLGGKWFFGGLLLVAIAYVVLISGIALNAVTVGREIRSRKRQPQK